MNFILKQIIPILAILAMGFVFHYRNINQYPSNPHAWAQSDRFAITQGFVNNNLNFLEPETYLLNPQFPDFWKTPKEESITSVDFPIHDFIPAVVMKITGVNSPWVNRLYVLIYSFFGLLALYNLALLLLKNKVKAFLFLILASTSPVFIFYQSSFLPTIPSLANSIIAIYFYFKYLDQEKEKTFRISLLFATLAALSRATFLIPLIAIICMEALRILKKKTSLRSKLIPVILSFGALASYLFYNNYLREKYGSSFLSTLIPAENFQEFLFKINQSLSNWGMEYFSFYQYLLIGILLFIAFVIRITKPINSSLSLKKFSLFVAILFLGNLFFLIAMTYQFVLHDYYFLDSFYLPVIFLFTPILHFTPTFKSNKTNWTLAVVVSCILIGTGYNSQTKRYSYDFWDKTESTITNYSLLEKEFESLNITKEAKILIFEPFAPNLPFTLMNRKGFSVMANRKEDIQKSLTWNYDYIVIQNENLLSTIYPLYPEILQNLSKIWSNGKISICVNRPTHQTINHFLGLDNKKPVFESPVEVENISNKNWNNIEENKIHKKDSNVYVHFPAGKEYGPAFSHTFPDLLKEEKTILCTSKIYWGKPTNCKVVVSVSNEEGENLVYYTSDLKSMVKTTDEWNDFSFIYNLPKLDIPNEKISLYFYDSGGSAIYFKDLTLKIFTLQ